MPNISVEKVDTATHRSSVLPSDSPFERLRHLLEGIEPRQASIDLSLGEPRHDFPDFVEEVLVSNLKNFGRYPPIKGTIKFRESVGNWLNRRYQLDDLIDVENGIVPLNGSREGLFFAALEAHEALGKKTNHPAILIPNPFYLVYSAAAYSANCEVIFLDCHPENDFLPDLANISSETLDRTVAIYLASPANPQGSVASLSYWQDLITLSRKHNFYVFADECYSEIYRNSPPCGLLEAARSLDGNLKGLIAFNSLSKRSNLPGLRLGFAAGDSKFLSQWVKFRGIAAPQVPLPIQAVAEAVYDDEKHVQENRRLYNSKFSLAKEKLESDFKLKIPEGGFFLWVDVSKWGNDIDAIKKLWRQNGLRVLPGSYIAKSDKDGRNPGANYIRIAMVETMELTNEALDRLVQTMCNNN